MNKLGGTAMSLNTPPAIHLGPLINPNTNETISILIPLAAQVATISGEKMEKPYNDQMKNLKPELSTTTTSTVVNQNKIRNDKTKGCPFPTCTRYGRAFSRAHDLKRHIARHEMRKEKLSDLLDKQQQQQQQQTNENMGNPLIAQRDSIQMQTKQQHYPEEMGAANVLHCPQCKKKYTSEAKFKAHLADHEKGIDIKNLCTLCGMNFQSNENLQEHMKQHTISILQAQASTLAPKSELSKNSPDKDDDFLLEEMLLLHKTPRNSGSEKSTTSSNPGKIRCDYCSKTFKTKWTLSSHVAAHEGRFQFDCGQCGKRFVRKSHYEGHVRSHEAARPYICDQCGKTFKELKHRREHTKRKHPNQNAIQNLLDSISSCAAEDAASSLGDQKFTLFMPVNFTTTTTST